MPRLKPLVIPVPGRHFSLAVLASTLLGGPAARLPELVDFYRMLETAEVEDVFLLGGAAAPGLDDEIDYLVKHFPWIPGIRTWYPCPVLARAMARAGRDDWRFLPPGGVRLLHGQVETPVHFVYEDGKDQFAAIRRQIEASTDDEIILFAGSRCPGEREHWDHKWLLRTGAMSGRRGTTVPISGVYADFRFTRAGRIAEDDPVFTRF